MAERLEDAGAAPAPRDGGVAGADATAARRASGAAASTSAGRFDLGVTPELRRLLKEGAGDPALPEELRRQCQEHADAEAVPWRIAQRLCELSRRA
jgi:hypothetical protein